MLVLELRKRSLKKVVFVKGKKKVSFVSDKNYNKLCRIILFCFVCPSIQDLDIQVNIWKVVQLTRLVLRVNLYLVDLISWQYIYSTFALGRVKNNTVASMTNAV